MALYDQPPGLDPKTGRVVPYKQVMSQADTGQYKVKYEYTKSAPLTISDMVLKPGPKPAVTPLPIAWYENPADKLNRDLQTVQTEYGVSGNYMNTGGGTPVPVIPVNPVDPEDPGNKKIELDRYGKGRGDPQGEGGPGSGVDPFNWDDLTDAELEAIANPNDLNKGIATLASGLLTGWMALGFSALNAYNRYKAQQILDQRVANTTKPVSPVNQPVDLDTTTPAITNKDFRVPDAITYGSTSGVNPEDYDAYSSPYTKSPITDAASISSTLTEDYDEDSSPYTKQDFREPDAISGGSIDITKRSLTGPQELGYTTRSDINRSVENYVRDGDIENAVEAQKTRSGYAGRTRDSAQTAMDQTRVGATRNNPISNYGNAKTDKERREVDDNEFNAKARDVVGGWTADPSRDVNRGSSVDNKARSNEVKDGDGNAVTDKNHKAVNHKDEKSGGSGGTRIICTELYRQGLISRKDYMLDLYYTSKHLTPQHTTGYWHFAVPAVKAMRRSKFWTAFWREIAYNRLQDIKWRLGYGKFTLRGRVYSAIFEPFCYISGYFKPNATYKELYKGEY